MSRRKGADKDGPLAGVPYDGKLTKADGKGLWWDGLDSGGSLRRKTTRRGSKKDWEWWEWNAAKGCSLPDGAYVQKVFSSAPNSFWDDYRPA